MTRTTLAASPVDVLRVAKEIVSAEGYQITEDRPDTGCLKTTLRQVMQGAGQFGKTLLTGLPPVTEQALAVRVKPKGASTELTVWLFPKSGSYYLAGTGQTVLASETRRMTRMIKERLAP